MTPEQKLAANRTYVRTIIRESGLKQKEFAKKHDIPLYIIQSGGLLRHLPFQSTYDKVKHVFPALYVLDVNTKKCHNRGKGNIFREARLKKGWTARYVADTIGVNYCTYLEWERATEFTSNAKLKIAAEMLGVTYTPTRQSFLTDEAAWDILTGSRPKYYYMNKYNTTISTINYLLRGKTHKKVYEEYQRYKQLGGN